MGSPWKPCPLCKQTVGGERKINHIKKQNPNELSKVHRKIYLSERSSLKPNGLYGGLKMIEFILVVPSTIETYKKEYSLWEWVLSAIAFAIWIGLEDEKENEGEVS